MNKIPLSVVALAAVAAPVNAAETTAAEQARQAAYNELTAMISAATITVKTYDPAVQTKYLAELSALQDKLNEEFNTATGEDVIDIQTYKDDIKKIEDASKALDDQYKAWDKLISGDFAALKTLNGDIKADLTETKYPYSYEAQKAEYDGFKADELIAAVDAAEEARDISNYGDFKDQIAAMKTKLTTFKGKMTSTEETEKAKALNEQAYTDVKNAIATAKDNRNQKRDALIALLPTVPYSNYQGSALTELNEQVTKLINAAEKSNEDAKEGNAVNTKAANLQLLADAAAKAQDIVNKWTGLKQVQEDAYADKNGQYETALGNFNTAKGVIDASKATYLNEDSTSIGKALRSLKASIDQAYANQYIGTPLTGEALDITGTLNEINVNISNLKSDADKAKADYDAHVYSTEKIDAKKAALKAATDEAKKKPLDDNNKEVGTYEAYGHFTTTSDDLQKKIDDEVKAKDAAYSASEKSKVGQAVTYKGTVDSKLSAIDIAGYEAKVATAKADYKTAQLVIEAAEAALKTLTETATDTDVTITGEIYKDASHTQRVATYADAIADFQGQIDKLKTDLATAVGTTPEADHLAKLAAQAIKSINDFESQSMAALTAAYVTNKPAYDGNLKIAAADDMLIEIDSRLTATQKELQAIVGATPNYSADGEFGVKGGAIQTEYNNLIAEFTTLSGKYNTAKSDWENGKGEFGAKDPAAAPGVIASLNTLQNDLSELAKKTTDLKDKAASAKENKVAYDEAHAWINGAIQGAIDEAQRVVNDNANLKDPSTVKDTRGQAYYNGVLSAISVAQGTLSSDITAAYTADPQTVKKNLESFRTRKNQLVNNAKAVAVNGSGTPSGDFVDNEKFHADQVIARDKALEEADKLYAYIETNDDTQAANDYLAKVAKIQEALKDMTIVEKHGIITDSLAEGKSKHANDEILDKIADLKDQVDVIKKDQLDGYIQAVLDDNDEQHSLFTSAYTSAYTIFQNAIKTLNKYATINNSNIPDAQDRLIETHDAIYAYAAKLLTEKNKEQAEYDKACDVENNWKNPVLYKTDANVNTVTTYGTEITSKLNVYLKAVNYQALTAYNSKLSAAQSALSAAETDATYIAFEYEEKAKAFKDVKDLVKAVEDASAVDPVTGTKDSEFAYNLFNKKWLEDLDKVPAMIAADQEAAAKAEYSFQLDKVNEIIKAEKAAINAMTNITPATYIAAYDAYLDGNVNLAIAAYAALTEGNYYANIAGIITNIKAFNATITTGASQGLTGALATATHTQVYWNAYKADVDVKANAEAFKELNELVAAAEKRFDAAAEWFDDLYTAHTDPAGTGVSAFVTLFGQFDVVAEGVAAKENAGAVDYRDTHKPALKVNGTYDSSISTCKNTAIVDELSVAQALIDAAKEKYNQLAKMSLEEAAKFDTKMADLQTTLDDINKAWTTTDASKKINADKAKASLLDLETTIATVDGDLAKKVSLKVIDKAHADLTASLSEQKAAIEAAKVKANAFDDIQFVYGEALEALVADNATLIADEAAKYTAGTVLMYQDNINNDIKKIQVELDAIVDGDTELPEGLTKLYKRYIDNNTYYNTKKEAIDAYQAKLDRVVAATADYVYTTTSTRNYKTTIQVKIDAALVALNATHDGIKANDTNTGVKAGYAIIGATDIVDWTAAFERAAANEERVGLKSALSAASQDARDAYNAIVTHSTTDGKRLNPTAQKELGTSIDSLLMVSGFVDNYGNDAYTKGKTPADINGELWGTYGPDDVYNWKPVNFLDAWYEEIHAKYNELIARAAEIETAVDTRSHVLGDVNLSGSINVADYDEVRKMILSDVADFDAAVKTFTEAKAYAADVNEDLAIDVADLTSISNFIFNGGFAKDQVEDQVARAKALAKVQCDDVLSLQAVSEETTLTGKTMRLAVNLDNSTDYVNYQMDVKLPEGMTLVGEKLTERANGHQLSSAALSNGSFRMVAENVENVAFGNQTAAVLYLDVQVDANYNGGEVEISNIIFSDAKGNAYRMSGLQTNAPTGIDSITAPTMTERIYSVGGQMMKAMKKGVNIIKGEGTVKKVVKK